MERKALRDVSEQWREKEQWAAVVRNGVNPEKEGEKWTEVPRKFMELELHGILL